jgi:hypothetical protein
MPDVERLALAGSVGDSPGVSLPSKAASASEKSRGDALQVEDRQQHLDRLRAPQVGREDGVKRTRSGSAGGGAAVADAGLADRAPPEREVMTGVGAVALAAVLSLEARILARNPRPRPLRLGPQRARALPQNFGDLIVKTSWLNQFDTLSLDTAYRSFGGAVEASSSPRYAALPIRAVTNFRR